MAEWDADWEIDDACVRVLVARHVEVETCVAFGEGWDNAAYLVNDAWVFRFPRREVAVPLLETEIAALPRLRELPLPIPMPVHVGEPSALFPHPYLGYRKLEGETACRVRPSDEVRDACADPLARFLAALHASEQIDVLPGDLFGRMDLAKRLQQVSERFREVVDAGALPSDEPWRALLRDVDPAYTSATSAVCHGDLYDRHLLMRDGAITGVIDWGDIHVGDPAVDLSMAHRFLPPSGLERFRRAYGEVDDATWAAARFRALHHSVACLRYALDVRDEDLARASHWSLQTLAI